MIIRLFIAIGMAAITGCQNPEISIVIDETTGSPVKHGLAELTTNLDLRGISYEKVNSLEKAGGETFCVQWTRNENNACNNKFRCTNRSNNLVGYSS